jgi:F-type H+-transporting ATPase subunit epsilon
VARTFRCSIVTPSETVLDQDVLYVTFPAWDGQQGVMTGQSPLLTRIGVGALRLDFPEGGSRWFLIDGGFAQVTDGQLNILTDRATPAENLSASEAQAELAEANARVAAPGHDRRKVEHAQQRAMAKRALAQAFAARGGAI